MSTFPLCKGCVCWWWWQEEADGCSYGHSLPCACEMYAKIQTLVPSQDPFQQEQF